MRTVPIRGYTDPRFMHVAEVFNENFELYGELGAALCIHHKGRKVVDIWGGVADSRTRASWLEDTMVPVFSTAKGMVAVACAQAMARGLLDWDHEVARYWPAFARNGKADITVRDILDHRAGLVLFGKPVRRDEFEDPDTISRITEDMTPAWRPGSRWGYHLATFGSLLAEILRRIDPAGRSFGRIFADEIAKPLGLAIHFGWPKDAPLEHLARIERPSGSQFQDAVLHTPAGLWWQALNPLKASSCVPGNS